MNHKTKKHLTTLAALLTLLACLHTIAAPGGSADPVVTKKYIDLIFAPARKKTVTTKAQTRVTAKTKSQTTRTEKLDNNIISYRILKNRILPRLERRVAGNIVFSGEQTFTVKRGTILQLGLGSTVTATSGTLRTEKNLLDTKTGENSTNGGNLPKKHLGYALKQTNVTVTSKTAKVRVIGFFRRFPPVTITHKTGYTRLVKKKLVPKGQALTLPATRQDNARLLAKLTKKKLGNVTDPGIPITWKEAGITALRAAGVKATNKNVGTLLVKKKLLTKKDLAFLKKEPNITLDTFYGLVQTGREAQK